MLGRTLLTALLAACTAAAHAQAYPAKPIRLVVPHAPGGNSDTFDNRSSGSATVAT